MSEHKKVVAPTRKPKPWYLGFGLAKFAADALNKNKKKKKKRLDEITKK